MKWVVIALCLCLGLGLLIVVFWPSDTPRTLADADRLLAIAVANEDRGRLLDAYDGLQKVLKVFPAHRSAQLAKARISISLGRGTEAAEALTTFSDEHLADSFEQVWKIVKGLADTGYFYDAQPFLQRLLRIRPDHNPTRRELLRFCRISGENATAADYLFRDVSRGAQPDLGDLLMATAPLINWANAADVTFMKSVGQRTQDPLIMLGYARRMMQSGQQSVAVGVLQQILGQRPDFQPAQAQLAILYWQLGRESEWRDVLSQWDPATLDHADSWFIWGVWELRQGDPLTAIRCFGESLKRDPKHSGSAAQLIVPLRKLGRSTEAVEWNAYVEQLAQLEQACLSVGQITPVQSEVRMITARCEALGWHQETRHWYRFARQRWPEINWTEVTADADVSQGDSEPTHRLPQQRLIAGLNYEQAPLPQRIARQQLSVGGGSVAKRPALSWHLDDEAAALGVNFRFHNGLQRDRKQVYMFEFSGPGIGVLDYDRDGWPDLHLTQGTSWPVQDGETAHQDALFRNLGDGTFTPVADIAGLNDPGYSQGPAVGDFNSDGFPDVYVCNIGKNRCYLNHGDGTFTEVTAQTATAGDEWSLSAAWADFNHDGLLDLYVVNYLTGDAFERACVGPDGRKIQCSPTFFPAASDRLYLNQGDGAFREISELAGIEIPDGKGMGLIVGRVPQSSRPGIFIANDLTPNFLFAPQDDPSLPVRFENVGAMAGVAFGPQGTAQSSMGIAAGDVNGDGLLDLFVTNFLAEPANLLIQHDGVFEDAANRFGLLAGGLTTEGWGTQFLDVDADGWLDLFVANGHLEEYSSADRMPSQLFHNLAGERFELVSGPSVGRYFSRNYLGRSVAIWDWNRDGREDLAVSHVTDPVAVLTNRTEQVGHHLELHLVGVQSSREPIGTQVKVSVGTRTLVRELTAGDGYAASNERRISFGLGDFSEPVNVEVEWCNGAVQQFSNLTVDRDYILVEGRPDAVSLPREILQAGQKDTSTP